MIDEIIAQLNAQMQQAVKQHEEHGVMPDKTTERIYSMFLAGIRYDGQTKYKVEEQKYMFFMAEHYYKPMAEQMLKGTQ